MSPVGAVLRGQASGWWKMPAPVSGLVFLNAPSGGTDTRVDHDPSDDRFWERVAAEPWIHPCCKSRQVPSGDLIIKFGPFPNDDTDATVTDARGSISPLGGCRQRTGCGLSLTRRILSTYLLLRTGSRVRYGEVASPAGREREPVSLAHCPGIWQELLHPML